MKTIVGAIDIKCITTKENKDLLLAVRRKEGDTTEDHIIGRVDNNGYLVIETKISTPIIEAEDLILQVDNKPLTAILDAINSRFDKLERRLAVQPKNTDLENLAAQITAQKSAIEHLEQEIPKAIEHRLAPVEATISSLDSDVRSIPRTFAWKEEEFTTEYKFVKGRYHAAIFPQAVSATYHLTVDQNSEIKKRLDINLPLPDPLVDPIDQVIFEVAGVVSKDSEAYQISCSDFAIIDGRLFVSIYSQSAISSPIHLNLAVLFKRNL